MIDVQSGRFPVIHYGHRDSNGIPKCRMGKFMAEIHFLISTLGRTEEFWSRNEDVDENVYLRHMKTWMEMAYSMWRTS